MDFMSRKHKYNEPKHWWDESIDWDYGIGFHRICQTYQYPPVLEEHWVKYNKANRDSCVLCLPGRTNHAREIALLYKKIGIESYIVGITPTIRSWYPMPNGIKDQVRAVAGIKPAIEVIDDAIRSIEEKRGIPRKRIVLTGHSAGAVMAIMTAVLSPSPFAAVISHCGAILDADMIPQCPCPETPFFLTHSKDDIVFEWHERFVPMFQTLKEKGYKLYTSIDNNAGHCITRRQLELSKYLIDICLNNKPLP
jgi:predicted esterase